MKKTFETTFHTGGESEKFIREFESKRADYSIREVADLPVDELKAIRKIFDQGICTFESPEKVAV